jgi:hypothetical protein
MTPCPLRPGTFCECRDEVETACHPIHDFFGLSYAHYMVLRRTVLQSMPKVWQAKFVELLVELQEATADIEEPVAHMRVTCLDAEFMKVDDPYRDYDQGRRRIPLKGVPACPSSGENATPNRGGFGTASVRYSAPGTASPVS